MSGYIFKNIVFFCSVDPDEMQHYAAFHLDLHRLKTLAIQREGAQWLSGRDRRAVGSSLTSVTVLYP